MEMMLRPNSSTMTALSCAALFLLGGCNPRESRERQAQSDRALAESAAVYEDVAARFRKVGETTNLQGPESARYDRDLDVWFVSNVNGAPTAKDNNGYISRLRPDGTPYNLKFIEGGKKGVTLNGPKGELSHPGPDQVIRITRSGATVALTSATLAGPNGITWDRKENRFVIVSFTGNGIYGWKPGDKDVKSLGTGPGQQDGVTVLPDGRILVTSWADSSLFVLDKGRSRKVATGIASPADIDFDEKDSRVAVPQLLVNKVQFWEVP
jgi:hypothetical protein